MELIYSMRRKPLKCEPPHYENNADPEVVKPICTISTCNIIAFSSLTELSDTDGDTWGGHVYICDLDTPWECHKVASTVHPVSALEWDGEGKQLLIATIVGEVSIYVQKDYLLNEWSCLYSAYFPGENIIKAVFFHNGRKVVAVEKKPDVPISDRIQMLRYVPTLKGFGGVACEGACIITGTGLVGALTPNGDSNRALVASDCLRSPRDHIATASFAHKNGSILIAAAWRGGGKRGVRCAACAVFRPPGSRAAPVQLTLQPLPTVYLLDHEPVSITWCLREDTDSLLIAGSTLTLWKLAERSYPVHKLLSKGPVQGNTTPGGGPKAPTECFNTVVWQQTAVWQVEGGGGGATHVGSVRLPLATPHVLLATPTALHLLNRDNHHYVCSRAIGSGLAADIAATPPKKTKYGGLPGAGGRGGGGGGGATVSCVEVSQLGAVCVAVDTHSQLHVFKLSQPAPDIPTTLSVQHTTMLLEYAMVSGYDSLDVIMTLKPNIVEAVYERLTESFQRQPQPFQQYYYHNWLKLRIALCSRVAGLTSSAASLCSLQLVLAGWSAAAASLRPDEKTEAALVSFAALSNMPDEHEEKNLLALEAKAESLGEGATSAGSAWGALSAMQPLYRPLQRALDTALTMLAALTAAHNSPATPATHHHAHGYEMWSDAVALNALRRMVVIARACARGGDALSRPLARLAAIVGSAPKPDLLEECASLTVQMPARVWDALPRCNVSAPHGKPWPLHLEYDIEPEALRFVPEPPAHAQCDGTPSLAMDSIRYMYLGGGRRAARWRRCGRCGSRSVPAALPAPLPARNAQQRAYDGRYVATCSCGGKWTLYSNI
ncbi:PREDICTED: mediator of RNA polymerase II transcription subunit 16 [Papilio xuthus]|uniref:Mediator of RNA polymerase II transcription subunit 16 n=1 Tax=Papilio xuthus TaxID=66420 RepID=A0AAJ6ZQQ7_PAPXU|nr:PREDICTED: mediator of RNA polymerase II transcription subunit 16 [Papilio xuthus]